MRVSTRLCQSDMLQFMTLLLVLLAFSLVVTWPTQALDSNDSWYALIHVEALAVSLLALGFGAFVSVTPQESAPATLGALLCFVVIGLPLTVGSYAASFPATPLGWSLAVLLLEPLAYFGIGLALGAAFAAARLRFLLPLMVPLLLGAMMMFDFWLGVPLFNPILGVSHIALSHLAMMALLSFGTLIYLVRSTRSREGEA